MFFAINGFVQSAISLRDFADFLSPDSEIADKYPDIQLSLNPEEFKKTDDCVPLSVAGEYIRKMYPPETDVSYLPFVPRGARQLTREEVNVEIFKKIPLKQKSQKCSRSVTAANLVKGDVVHVMIDGEYKYFLLYQKHDDTDKQHWEARFLFPYHQFATSIDIIVPLENGYTDNQWDPSFAVVDVCNSVYLHFQNDEKVTVSLKASENLLTQIQAVYDQVIYDTCSNLPVNYDLDEDGTRLAKGVRVMTGHPCKKQNNHPYVAKQLTKMFLNELNEKTLAEIS